MFRFARSDNGEVIAAAEIVRAGGAGGPAMIEGPEPPGWHKVFADYPEEGLVHIRPRGPGHILFVLGLFLLSARLSALPWQVSAGTLAHTVTLVLGATGPVVLPASIVEPLSAASILHVAVKNRFTRQLHRWRPPVVFCSGLLHGPGCAGVLSETGLPARQCVISPPAFNSGDETGQIAVIAAAFAPVGRAARFDWYRRAVTIPGSLIIAVVAACRIIQRVGLV